MSAADRKVDSSTGGTVPAGKVARMSSTTRVRYLHEGRDRPLGLLSIASGRLADDAFRRAEELDGEVTLVLRPALRPVEPVDGVVEVAGRQVCLVSVSTA